MEPIRINKYLRDKGLCSRREADALIAEGKILVNGKKAVPGMLVSDKDRVELKKGWEKEHVYLAYYKPAGLPTQGEKGEKSVITHFRDQGLYPIGRLDKESEGLLLLTNDGRITESVLGAENKLEKEYVVEVKEKIREGIPAILKKGMKTEALGTLLPAKGNIVGERTMHITLVEGKRHQIRVMLSELGLTVKRLKRIRIGEVGLKGIRAGHSRALDRKEIDSLLP